MAGVALSSLRVSGDFDASGYVRGASQKTAADAAMIASDKARNASLAQADAAMAKSIPGVATLSRSLLAGYGAGLTFEGQIRKIGNAVDHGLGLDRANVLLEATYRKFGLTADAAGLVAQGFVSIAPSIDALNSRMAAATENARRVQVSLEAVTAAQRAQSAINSQFGIGANDNSAARAADVAAYGAELDRLRSKFVPLVGASQRYRADLDEINQAARVGAISERERAAAISSTKAAFAEQVVGLRQAKSASNEAAAAAGLHRHEIINLSRQAQDVVVSLAGGQGLGTVLLQQGSQIGDVFASSTSTVGGFARQATSWLGNFLTVGRVAFGGVTLAITGSTLALSHFLAEQDRVAIALSGAGRASGASVQGINATADAGASIGGLSVSAARDLAAALAATGKIGSESLLPIVKIGRDFATTFGVTDVEATKQLAAAFADPVRGADQLNDRLGFLDAGMQRQIASLTAQNRLYDAQKLLLQGVQSGLANTAEVTSAWTKIWTGLKNASSDTFDAIGKGIADTLHLNDSLEQQRAASQKRLDSYSSTLGSIFGSKADYENEKRQLAEINALIEKRALATQNAAAAQTSLRVQQTIMAQLPEIGIRQALADAAAVGGAAAEDPVLMQKLGLTQAQVDRARLILQQLKSDFKTTFEDIQSTAKISFDAVTAFSPSARAAIAQRQAIEQYRAAGGLDPSEKAKIGQDAYTLSIHQTTTALSEAARVRVLNANQSVQSAALESQLLGRSIGQQAELRANLQARQQLEQEAAQSRTAFDDAQYERLKKINAELGRQAQISAANALNDNIRFSRSTAFLSSEDVQIAQQLRGLYPDIATALDSVQASGIRVNGALSGLASTASGQLTTGLADIADGTKTISQGANDMGKSVARAIEEMIIKLYVVIPLMRALQSTVSSLGFGLGGAEAAGATSTGAAGVGGIGGLYAKGGAFNGGNVIPFARGGVVSRPTLFPMANGAGLMGEAGPEAVMPLRRGADGKLGVSASGAGASVVQAPKVTVNLIENSSRAGQTEQRTDGNGGLDLDVFIDSIMAKNIAKPGSATSQTLAHRGRLTRR